MNTKFYIDLSGKKPKLIDFLLLALTIPDEIEPVTINSFTVSWTLEALAEFELIKNSISDKNKKLPYASLRGLLQIAFDNLAYLDSSIGLVYTKITNEEKIEPFAYLSEGENNLITQKIRPVLDEWITHYLQLYVINNSGDIHSLNKLQDLWQENNLVKIKDVKSQILPWKWSQTGTTQGNHNYSYKDLVEYIARQIAGKEILKKKSDSMQKHL